MTKYEALKKHLEANQYTWLTIGVAGLIGSNLLEALLNLNQRVVGLDNFSTGFQHNLDEVIDTVGEDRWQQFNFIKGDIRSLEVCNKACVGVDYVLHPLANISKAKGLLGYKPIHTIEYGMKEAMAWYISSIPQKP